MIQYIAIFEQADGTKFVIEYRPCYDEIAGSIEVQSVDVIERPHTWREQRAEYRRSPEYKPPHTWKQPPLLDEQDAENSF
jgi:hypothetical protein